MQQRTKPKEGRQHGPQRLGRVQCRVHDKCARQGAMLGAAGYMKRCTAGCMSSVLGRVLRRCEKGARKVRCRVLGRVRADAL
ncbi:hypothetical protein ACLB2K_024119 [Fragaria x ananassa]